MVSKSPCFPCRCSQSPVASDPICRKSPVTRGTHLLLQLPLESVLTEIMLCLWNIWVMVKLHFPEIYLSGLHSPEGLCLIHGWIMTWVCFQGCEIWVYITSDVNNSSVKIFIDYYLCILLLQTKPPSQGDDVEIPVFSQLNPTQRIWAFFCLWFLLALE